MTKNKLRCTICKWEDETGRKVDTSNTPEWWADQVGTHRTTITRHLGHAPSVQGVVSGESEKHDESGGHYVTYSASAWGYDDYRTFIQDKGMNPDQVTFTWGWTSNPSGGFWNKLNNVRPIGPGNGAPKWPIVEPAEPVKIPLKLYEVEPVTRNPGYKLAMKAGDSQIGYRILADGTLDPFHDDAAMAVFVAACAAYQPDKITILGDFLDLTSQGRFTQEASFARSTQPAINRGHRFLAELRAACPDAEMVLVEGNHDLRMQTFIQNNALAAFGLKRAEAPDEWPVMSLPFLLRLEELGVRYIDAYPAATDWDNDLTRNIHGTKVNSRGSTTAQYVSELPHVNTWAGHTHRAEITYKSVLGARGEPIESYSANPGVLCRTDGAVPGVNGAIGSDGTAARIVEDWQQGFGMLWFNEDESIPQVYRIRNGRTLVDGRVITGYVAGNGD